MFYDWIRHMTFAYPLVFPLFALLPVLIWWYVKKSSNQQATVKVSTTHAFTASSFKIVLRHVPFILRMLAFAALIVALARPQKRNDQEHLQGEGIDIILCMDV